MARYVKMWPSGVESLRGVRYPRTQTRHLLASCPNEILAIDFTLLEPSHNGLENVLVMTDVFSKYTLAVPTRDQRASTVAQALVSEWFFKFEILKVFSFSSCVSFMGLKNLAQLYTTLPVMASVSALTELSTICCKPFLRLGNGTGIPVCHKCSALITQLPTSERMSLHST